MNICNMRRMRGFLAAMGVMWIGISTLAQTTQGVAVPKGGAKVQWQMKDLPKVDVADADKFLNDLKLSPYWKVTKNRSGKLVADARGITTSDPFGKTDELFVFELIGQLDAKLPMDCSVDNDGIKECRRCFGLSATIVFEKPNDPEVNYLADDGTISLNINGRLSIHIILFCFQADAVIESYKREI